MFLSLFISACTNNISVNTSAQSWIGKSITQRVEVSPKRAPIIRVLKNGVKEYEFHPYESYPSCTIAYTVDETGIIQSYQVSGKCK
jgi:hypothetical protein